jgi:diguanylate cyclase (GGDEF)-like protein
MRADILSVISTDTDASRPRDEHLDAVAESSDAMSRIAELLETCPASRLVAGAPDTRPMIVPESVPVRRERCLDPRVFDTLVPDDYAVLIGALDESRCTGHGRARIHFAVPDSETVTIDVFDTVREFDAVLCVLSVDDPQSGFLDLLGGYEVVPRRSRLTQDDLGLILAVDEPLARALGYGPGELVGHRSIDFVHPDDLHNGVQGWRELLGDPAHPRLERMRYRARGGEYVWFDVMQMNRLADDGVIVWTFADVSGEIAAQQRVVEREQLLHQITESLPLGVVQVDANGVARHTNSRLAAVLGFPLLSHLDDVCQYVSAADGAALRNALAAVLGGQDADVRVTVTPPQGRARVCEVNMRCLSGNSVGGGALVCFTEVTEAVRLQQQLVYQASHDALTGCLNRQAVLAFLEEDLARGEGALGAVFIDLDLFKLANDRHGHAAGDQILGVVGRRLRGLLRSGDAAGRLGGDEFLVVFRDVSSVSEARMLGDRVVAALTCDIKIADATVHVTASVGVGWARRETVTGDEIVAHADAAMYAAKSNGGRACVVYQAPEVPRQEARSNLWPAGPVRGVPPTSGSPAKMTG